ncbi:MAG TPA: bifunctional tetrahydrofolate synthase/dihydrofolate synthase [Casimicrobiaceae bacterium]|nr:bifunctional tetrahydrofolate synthase/dihydrofolate synthase [Casimicrobiaceae bacterium]
MVRPGFSSTLAEWLAYLETLHPKPIAMGLERVAEVATRIGVRVDCPVITVAGTNGKGSTCAMLESIYRRAGYRTGLYTSPHLVRFNERVRIAGAEVDDATLTAALTEVEAARSGEPGQVSLTYFEFSTLAALRVFAAAGLDVLVLEVGLGGRLDAVNIVDADVAVITTIDIDHVEYLGSTRDAIAREKAGIMRSGRIAICGDPDPPRTLVERAREIGAPLWRIGHEYRYRVEGLQWRYEGPRGARYGLPHPALRGRYQLANAATVLAALDALHAKLPVQGGALRDGLVGVELAGRFQVLPGRPAAVLDVAHNPHAARALAATLDAMGRFPRTFAVFGMLADKDIDGVIAALAPRIDVWHVAPLPGPRGAKAEHLAERLVAAGVAHDAVRIFADVARAWRAATDAAGEADRIAAFGSFLTIAAVLASIRERTDPAA